MRFRNPLQCSLLFVLVLAIAGCGGSSEKSAGGRQGTGGGGQLITVLDTSPTNLDSRVGADIGSARIFDLVYSGLVKPTTKSDYAPDLAEWEIPDDRTIVFRLKPNVKFHDGRPLTSQDVKFTYDSLINPSFVSSKKSGYASIASVEAPDPQTVIFRLKEPNGGIFDNLTLGILPQGADPEVFKKKPIGAGPYKVVDFQTDDRVELEAFDGFHGGPPKIKRIIVRIVPDATTRVLELQQRGSINLAINNVPYDQVSKFESSGDFKVLKEPGAYYQYLAFNLKDPILKKQQVRKAIAHAIDRDRIVRDLLRGHGTVTDTMFSKGHWARAENLPTHAFNPAQAKSLLDAAGHRDPDGDGPKSRFKLMYKTSTDAEANQQAEMIQQMLKQVGIDVQIQQNEFGVFFEDIQKGNFQLFSLRRAGIVDPDFYYTIFHSESLPPAGQNRGYYVNRKVDDLIKQGRATFDRAKRKEIYGEIQKILAEELPYVSLYNRVNVAVMRNNVDGFEMYPSGFWNSIPNMTVK